MSLRITVQTVQPRKLAAVRREVAPGHNVFLYHHPSRPPTPDSADTETTILYLLK
jgi:hypothetical protein